MIVRQSLADVPTAERSVALGSFDGVHLGHQAVIGAAVATAAGARPALGGADVPPAADRRPAARGAAGAALVAQPAGRADRRARRRRARDRPLRPRVRARSRPTSSPPDVLAETLGARHVSVGENFHYGRGAQGNPAKLRRGGATAGVRRARRAAARDRRRPGLVLAGARADGRGRRRGGRPRCWAGRPGSREPSCAATAAAASSAFPTANLALVPRSPSRRDRHLRRHRPPARVEPHRGDQRRLQPDLHGRPQRGAGRGLPARLRRRHLRLADPARPDNRLRDEIRYDVVDDLLAQLDLDIAAVRALQG